MSGTQCISQCYNKGSKIVHPITLKVISQPQSSFCAINPSVDHASGRIISIDQCVVNKNNDTNNNQIHVLDKLDILNPLIYFDYIDFLNKYYKINDISDFYIWLNNNKTSPYLTQLRIIDCFINGYGHNVTFLDEAFTDAIYNITKKFWIKKIYKNLCDLVDVKDNVAYFVKPEKNSLKKKDNIEIRTRFLFDELITKSNIATISNDFFSDIVARKKNNIGIHEYYDYLTDKLREIKNKHL
jgi:hypothetical protein